MQNNGTVFLRQQAGEFSLSAAQDVQDMNREEPYNGNSPHIASSMSSINRLLDQAQRGCAVLSNKQAIHLCYISLKHTTATCTPG